MARTRFSRSFLNQQRARLALYQRLLPSLDLKRRKLSVELSKASADIERAHAARKELERRVSEQLPMLAASGLDLSRLLRVESVDLGEQNLVGVKLPTLRAVKVSRVEYAYLGTPAWVDVAMEYLVQAIEQSVQEQVLQERERRIARALRRMTQRVNLFDKVLIPSTRRLIKKTQIFLADAERAQVVRSKIIKARLRAEGSSAEPEVMRS